MKRLHAFPYTIAAVKKKVSVPRFLFRLTREKKHTHCILTEKLWLIKTNPDQSDSRYDLNSDTMGRNVS